MLNLAYIYYLVRNYNNELKANAFKCVVQSQGVKFSGVIEVVKTVRQELNVEFSKVFVADKTYVRIDSADTWYTL